MSTVRGPRPGDDQPAGVQHERTALAWERTAIATMVAGLAFTRVLTSEGHPALGTIGVIWVLGGGWLSWWAATHHDVLHNPRSPVASVPQTALTVVVGVGALALAVAALVTGIVMALV